MNLFSSSGQCFTHDGTSDLASWVLELPWWIFTPDLQCFLNIALCIVPFSQRELKKHTDGLWLCPHYYWLALGYSIPVWLVYAHFFILLFQVIGPCQHFMQSLFARKEFSWILLIWDFIYLWWLRDDLGDVDSQLTASSKAHEYT